MLRPEELFRTETFLTWRDLVGHYRDNSEIWARWIFRGHRKSSWGLKSSLELAALDRFHCNPAHMLEVERGLLRKFKREAHHYLSRLPDADDFMQWLALMQHFGAPTRLLDWSYSFYVAAHFAIERLEPGGSCAIWGFDSDWWRARALQALPPEVAAILVESDPNAKKPETVAAILQRDDPLPMAFQLNPYRLNERLVLQQGIFVAPADVRVSFMENLGAIAAPEAPQHLVKLELRGDSEVLRNAIRELTQMNISRATLFPGLDGFATNLKNLISFPETIATDSPGSEWSPWT